MLSMIYIDYASKKTMNNSVSYGKTIYNELYIINYC